MRGTRAKGASRNGVMWREPPDCENGDSCSTRACSLKVRNVQDTNLWGTMARRWRFTLGLAALLLPIPAAGQLVCPPEATDSTRQLPPRPPDVVIRASVTARTLRFNTQPRAEVRA